MDNNAVSSTSVGKHYQVNGSSLSRHYKNHLSGYQEWEQLLHAEEWILFPENLGTIVCLDEVALSDGELYTVLTNLDRRTQKGCLICMVKGVKSKDVNGILARLPLSKRLGVKEISVDMANSMGKIARESFPNASVVTDRFHVAQLVTEALQEMRIKHRWEAIDRENKQIKKAKEEGKKHIPKVFPNGDTRKQLLARSRYLLFKPHSKWTRSQQNRAQILFNEYPDLRKGYELSMMFRGIYETSKCRQDAEIEIEKWFEKVKEKEFPSFITAAESIENHKQNILNFFLNRTTNAMAETFNSKIKAFRSVFRGVKDLGFFLFRVSLIFA